MDPFNQLTKSVMRKLRLLLPTLFILSLVPCVLNSISTVSCIDQFINRKAMFLFCNAILLFIARDSGLLLPPSVSNLYDEISTTREGSDVRPRNDFAEVKETNNITVISDKLVSEQSIITTMVEENHMESLELVVVEEVSEELEITCDAFVSQNADPICIHNVNSIEQIDQDGLEVDEFNRRCEEFIERIKRARQMEMGRRIAIK